MANSKKNKRRSTSMDKHRKRAVLRDQLSRGVEIVALAEGMGLKEPEDFCKTDEDTLALAVYLDHEFSKYEVARAS